MLGDDGEVRLFLAKNQVAFQLDGVLLVSRLIDGTFPDYERVIPESSPEKVELDRREFFHMVRRVALLATDQANLVRLAFGKAQLVMTSSSPELGEARVSMPIKYEGKEIEIAFNPDFLKDVLSSMDEEVVSIELTDSLSPGIDPRHLVDVEVVRFTSFDGLVIPALYYRPHAGSTDEQIPALVWVHR